MSRTHLSAPRRALRFNTLEVLEGRAMLTASSASIATLAITPVALVSVPVDNSSSAGSVNETTAIPSATQKTALTARLMTDCGVV